MKMDKKTSAQQYLKGIKYTSLSYVYVAIVVVGRERLEIRTACEHYSMGIDKEFVTIRK